MIPINNDRLANESDWQAFFWKCCLKSNDGCRLAFRQLGPEAREDAIEEGIVHTLLSYSRLHSKGRAERANASSLAWYAIRAVKRGRPAVGPMNGKEPLSRYAQVGQWNPIGAAKWRVDRQADC